MILYCDTSALIKLYLQEESSTLMLDQAATASLLVSCRISWAEAIAAMARRARETPKDASTIALAQQRFQTQWNHFAIVEVTQTLVELAGNYADTFALRGYDSVQLAAARIVQESSSDSLQFACFDERLCKAAKVLGMQVIEKQD